MKMVEDKVKVTLEKAEGEKEAVTIEAPVRFPEYETMAEIKTPFEAALNEPLGPDGKLGPLAEAFIGEYNYGVNLKARQKVRAKVMADNKPLTFQDKPWNSFPAKVRQGLALLWLKQHADVQAVVPDAALDEDQARLIASVEKEGLIKNNGGKWVAATPDAAKAGGSK